MARNRRRADSGISGCVIIDKPAGCTSHDVVDQLRRRFGTRKVGHAGTLDPDATGVLVLGIGVGTKLLQFVTGVDKTYTTEIVFGVETSTLDSSGEVTARHDMELQPGDVGAAAEQFVGPIEQIPPMVSAIKVDGKRLHELAREGKEVEREPRPVTVHRYEVEPTDEPLVYRAEIECSSGTYVRSLAADLGTALGGGAHVRNLRRSAVGSFLLAEAGGIDEAELLAVGELLRGMPTLDIDAEQAIRVGYGQTLGPSPQKGRLAIRDDSGTVLAVYEDREGELWPVKVLQY